MNIKKINGEIKSKPIDPERQTELVKLFNQNIKKYKKRGCHIRKPRENNPIPNERSTQSDVINAKISPIRNSKSKGVEESKGPD